MPLPWALAERLPALDNVLPVRFSMYVALAAAVAAALWAASPRPAWWLRAALLGAAAVSLLPALSRDLWNTTPTRPAFFADEIYRECFDADENVFVPDAAGIDATLWQVESGYRFRLANGSLSPEIPEGIPDRGRRDRRPVQPRARRWRRGGRPARARARGDRDPARRRARVVGARCWRTPGSSPSGRAGSRSTTSAPRLPILRGLLMGRVASRLLRSTFGPLAIYGRALARVLRATAANGSRELVGTGYDPQFYVWALGWWPHAILNGENPFVTYDVWPVTGVNLAWSVTVPALAISVAPLTLIAGPVIAYNLVAVAMPVVAAWTAFLLCRYVTGSWWASLAGGYLFGFSSYMLGHTMAHPGLTSVFLVPLVALTMLHYVDGKIGRRALALRLGLLLGIQPYLSTEVLATLTVASRHEPRRRVRARSGGALAASERGAPRARRLRHRVRRRGSDPLLRPHGLPQRLDQRPSALPGRPAQPRRPDRHDAGEQRGRQRALPQVPRQPRGGWRLPRAPTAGRARLVRVAAVASPGRAHARRAAGARDPRGARRGAPRRRRARRGASVGARGRSSRGSTTSFRFGSRCTSRSRPRSSPRSGPRRPRPAAWLRAGLVLAAAITLVPDPSQPFWRSTPARPAFFADDTYRACFRPDENVFIPSVPNTGAAIWQAESGYDFRLANGNLGSQLPDGIPHPEDALSVLNGAVPDGGGARSSASRGGWRRR